ncbi:hypothetical protein [Morganella psychrotolerans]|uniref:Fimbrial protein n=1 Tax=Morganella psychrotolerans TaxID=368603 RepID=A0A1B8HPC8_9GAMM|nr:hypothetical protein [Morganella psychrotolerans]OBU11232.1 hypothetical protein AYY17_00260 [Morganella psychrotolerans]
MKIKLFHSLLLLAYTSVSAGAMAGTCGKTIDLAITIGSQGVVLAAPDKPVEDGSLGVIYAGEVYVLRENGRTVQNGLANKDGQVRYNFVIGQLYQLDNIIQPRTFMITDAGCTQQLINVR